MKSNGFGGDSDAVVFHNGNDITIRYTDADGVPHSLELTYSTDPNSGGVKYAENSYKMNSDGSYADVDPVTQRPIPEKTGGNKTVAPKSEVDRVADMIATNNLPQDGFFAEGRMQYIFSTTDAAGNTYYWILPLNGKTYYPVTTDELPSAARNHFGISSRP